MNKYQVVAALKVRTRAGAVKELLPGEVVKLSSDMAAPLLEDGRIRVAPLPCFDAVGALVIPFDSDPRFHWWNGGQSIKEIEEEVRRWLH